MNTVPQCSSHHRPPLSAWRLCLALITLLAFGATAQAATYYVDNVAGNDSSTTPTNINTPWKTIGKVNATTFAPGDSILFKRGVTWTGTGLVVGQSGTSNSLRITYGAYPATGAKPQINDTTASGVLVSNRSYIQVQDLSLSRNGALGVQLNDSNFVTILRVDVADNGSNAGINASSCGNVVIDGCTVQNGKSNGIRFGGTLTNKNHDSVIQNCVVDGTLSNDGIVLHDGATAADTNGANFILRNNVARNGFEQGYDITSGTNILLENNVSSDNGQGAITIGHNASAVTVRYHRSTNEPTANTSTTLTMSGANVTVEYSTFIGSATQDQTLVNVSAGSAGQQPNNLTLRDNVFVWNTTLGGNILQVGDHWSGVLLANENLTIKNNIFTSRTSAVPVIRFSAQNRPLNYASYVIRNNLYDNTPGIAWNNQGTGYANFAAYKAAFNPSGSWNEKSGDPLFVNAAAGDFHLASTSSPAFDAGTSTLFNGEPAMLTADQGGVTTPQGAARDIGAYEFPVAGSVPLAPNSLTATKDAANPTTAINLAWQNVANETGYSVERKTGAGGTYAEVTTRGTDVVTWPNTGLTPGTQYFYRVRSYNGNGYSVSYSPEANATTDSAGGTTVTFTSNATGDGWVLESGENTNVGGTINSTDATTSALRVGDDTAKKQYKSILSFDTSSLPDGATILSATLKLKRGTQVGTVTTLGTLRADQRTYGFNGNGALEAADFQAPATVAQAVTLNVPTANGALASGNLNAAGLTAINKVGATQFRVYFSTDDDNDTANDYLGFYSGNDATAANRPVLEVTYQ